MFIWNNMHQLLIRHKTCSKEVNSQFWHHVDFICYLWDRVYIYPPFYISYCTEQSCLTAVLAPTFYFICCFLLSLGAIFFLCPTGHISNAFIFVRQCKSFRKEDVSEVFKKMLDVSLSIPCISSHVWDPF